MGEQTLGLLPAPPPSVQFFSIKMYKLKLTLSLSPLLIILIPSRFKLVSLAGQLGLPVRLCFPLLLVHVHIANRTSREPRLAGMDFSGVRGVNRDTPLHDT